MVPAGNKAKRFLLVSITTKIAHHYHHYHGHHHHHQRHLPFLIESPYTSFLTTSFSTRLLNLYINQQDQFLTYQYLNHQYLILSQQYQQYQLMSVALFQSDFIAYLDKPNSTFFFLVRVYGSGK